MWRGPRRVLLVCDDTVRRRALADALAGFDVVEADDAGDAADAVDDAIAVVLAGPDVAPGLRDVVRERTPAARLVILGADGAGEDAVPPDAGPALLRLVVRLAVERAAAENRRRIAEDDRWSLAIENGALRSFSYAAAHDLRTPLRHVAGFADELLEDHAGALGGEGRALARHIVDGCVRLDRTLEQLLRLARADRAEVERQRIDLSALVRSVVDETQREGAPPIELECQERVEAVADPHLLRLALLNRKCSPRPVWAGAGRT